MIFENKHRTSVMGSGQAPYLDKLASKGASMTHSYGVTHPSQPNYLALFSSVDPGVTGNGCPLDFRKANNLGHQLRKSGRSFIGYAESPPRTGFLADVHLVATNASTTCGSTSARCPQAPTGRSVTSRMTTASCPLCPS